MKVGKGSDPSIWPLIPLNYKLGMHIALGIKFDLTIKQVKVNLGSSFVKT